MTSSAWRGDPQYGGWQDGETVVLVKMKEEAASIVVRDCWLLGHRSIELRQDGRTTIFYCTLCETRCYSDAALADHLEGSVHARHVAGPSEQKGNLHDTSMLPSQFAHVSYLSTAGPSETRVLSFGAGSSGGLGHGGGVLAEDVYEPLKIAGLPGALVAVACGHHHSMAVTNDGEVWAWGRNSEGRLGRGQVQSDLSRGDWTAPAKVTGLEKIRVKQVAGSGVVSLAV